MRAGLLPQGNLGGTAELFVFESAVPYILYGAAFFVSAARWALTRKRSKMMKELNKIYEPKQVEDTIYADWLAHDYFHTKRDAHKKPY
ncbi:MAG: hypothetical protein RSC00_04240, partial [Ruthenibacterium sp.]